MSLLRSNLVVASGTALSRATGLLRVLVVGQVLGQNVLSDAYLTANETPNIVYDLLLGGVLSATLVPLFTTYLAPRTVDNEHDAAAKADAQRGTNVIITMSVTLMLALTAVAVLSAPLIIRLYTLRYSPDVDIALYRSVATSLARIFLVQILFYGLTGVANSYLNSRRRFFAAAWSPVLSNLVIIASLLSLPDAGTRVWALGDVLTDSRLRWTLGLGATLGIASMALVVVPAMVAAGLRFRPVFDFGHPAVRRLLTLSGWTIGFVIANQVALVIIRNLTLGLGQGLSSAYINAFTFFMLPYGLLAVSISTTFQPELARAVQAHDRPRFVDQATLGVRSITALTMPAAALLLTLPRPIIGLMSRGQYDADSVSQAATALGGFAVGLVGFAVYQFVLRGFYAHQDTRTPFVLNVVENALNIAIAFALIRWFGLLGLTLSYALAYLIAALLALNVLHNKVGGFPLRTLWSSVWRQLLAAVLMAEAIWFVTRPVDIDVGWVGVAQLVVGATVGLTVYLAVLFALRSPEVDAVERLLRRRFTSG